MLMGYHANTIFMDDIAWMFYKKMPEIKKAIFNDPATIVFWDDGTKTVVKCGEDDTYDKEKGLALCYMKRLFDNKGRYNEVLKKWCVEEESIKEEPYWLQGREFLMCSKCECEVIFPVKKCPKCGSIMKGNWEEA
jgi:hypothetical protein